MLSAAINLSSWVITCEQRVHADPPSCANQRHTGLSSSAVVNVSVSNGGPPCTVTAIDFTQMEFPADGGTGTNTFAVSPAGCLWTASTLQDWISVQPARGAVTVDVAPTFLISPRFGTVMISDRAVTIIQEARLQN